MKKTVAQICFNENLEGFKRDFFAYGQKRKGGNLIMACEVPRPWSRCLGHERKKWLSDFFQECPDIQIIGNDKAASFPIRTGKTLNVNADATRRTAINGSSRC